MFGSRMKNEIDNPGVSRNTKMPKEGNEKPVILAERSVYIEGVKVGYGSIRIGANDKDLDLKLRGVVELEVAIIKRDTAISAKGISHQSQNMLFGGFRRCINVLGPASEASIPRTLIFTLTHT